MLLLDQEMIFRLFRGKANHTEWNQITDFASLDKRFPTNTLTWILDCASLKINNTLTLTIPRMFCFHIVNLTT